MANRPKEGTRRTVRRPPKKKGLGAKRICLIILVILLAAVLVTAVTLGVIYRDTIRGWFTPGPAVAVTVEDTVYVGDANGIIIYTGNELTISTTSAEEPTLRILAAKGRNFAYTVGSEPYQWADVAGDDFTQDFGITKTDKGYKIDYDTLEEILLSHHGMACRIAEDADLTGDLFELVVACGKTELHLSFGIGLPADGVLFVTPGAIIF